MKLHFAFIYDLNFIDKYRVYDKYDNNSSLAESKKVKAKTKHAYKQKINGKSML